MLQNRTALPLTGCTSIPSTGQIRCRVKVQIKTRITIRYDIRSYIGIELRINSLVTLTLTIWWTGRMDVNGLFSFLHRQRHKSYVTVNVTLTPTLTLFRTWECRASLAYGHVIEVHKYCRDAQGL